MQSSSNLMAPGRMDVVQQVLSDDPYFSRKLRESGRRKLVNRRGVSKVYAGLTIDLVGVLAAKGLDAIAMRRDEVIAKAFEFCHERECSVAA